MFTWSYTFPTVAKYSPSGDHLAMWTDAAVLDRNTSINNEISYNLFPIQLSPQKSSFAVSCQRVCQLLALALLLVVSELSLPCFSGFPGHVSHQITITCMALCFFLTQLKAEATDSRVTVGEMIHIVIWVYAAVEGSNYVFCNSILIYFILPWITNVLFTRKTKN